MLKVTLNQARLVVRLVPKGPLCVKSGDKALALLHPELPDLMCVRTHLGGRETVYIPGSSLKGVVRSSAERVLRSLGLSCCDPLDQNGPCQKEASRLGDDIARKGGEGAHPMAPVYRKLCLACRTFGSQAMASRVAFGDACPPESESGRANDTEIRSGVSIDRRTGGPARGKLFEQEVVTGGAFDTAIHLRNYELWQLALVGLVLREMDDGFTRVGSAKSRGCGHVGVELRSLVVDQVAGNPPASTVAGPAVLAPGWREAYGLIDDRALSEAAVGPQPQAGALGHRFAIERHAAVRQLLDALLDHPWTRLIQAGPGRTQ